MDPLLILRDTREQKGWRFDSFETDINDVTLTTGDYTLAEFCNRDHENDTYHPRYAIERKSGSDFISSITATRDRFKREIKRASDWPSPLLVIIEEPRDPSRYQDDIFKYHDIKRETALATVDAWDRQHNVSFRFAGDRERAQQIAFDTLTTRLRATSGSPG